MKKVLIVMRIFQIAVLAEHIFLLISRFVFEKRKKLNTIKTKN